MVIRLLKLIKRCTKCKTLKPLSEFYMDRSRKDGRDHRCKQCSLEWARNYAATHKEDKKVYDKKHYWANKERILKRKKLWYENNPEHVKEYRANYYKNNKKRLCENNKKLNKAKRDRLISFLCSGDVKCQNHKCGFNDVRALVIDHITNDGYKDRKRFKTQYALIAYYLIHPKEAKEKLQILCSNCNMIKARERWNSKHSVHSLLEERLPQILGEHLAIKLLIE